MSATVSGNLPAGDGNGLESILHELIHDPKKMHLVLAIVDCKKTTTDNDSGEVKPVVRIRRLEVVVGEEDHRVATRLLRRALDVRTGREALPYDLDAELSDAFPQYFNGVTSPEELPVDEDDNGDGDP